MKKLLILAALAATLTTARAGWLTTGTVTVAPGATTASADITLGTRSGNDACAIDSLGAANLSGACTGLVSFVSRDFGFDSTIATNYIVTSGSGVLYPARVDIVLPTTNANPYVVRNLRVTVTLAKTNSVPTVFSFGAITR